MGNDFEEWKRRREAARREAIPSPPARTTPPPPPPAAASSVPARPRRGRGCAGCLGTVALVGLALVVVVGVLGATYWSQIRQRGPVHVLILGIDARPTETPPFRSDTMILAGFAPARRTVSLLSIPRDLWVPIPSQGENRINTAHFSGGPTLAKQSVSAFLQVPVHYYVRIDFDGFVAIVDALDGIAIDVPEPLHDEQYPTADYGVTTVDIPAGPQQMDGATALIYARSRYSTDDFDRSRRQQEVMVALQSRLMSRDGLRRLPRVWQAIQSHVSTDMPARDYPALALILARSEIQRAAIGAEESEPMVTSGGAQVLRPLPDRIQPLVDQYFR